MVSRQSMHQTVRTLEHYVYEPLTSQTSIRILELLPGEKNDYIQCRLSITTRDEAPEYEALSYVWGDPSDKRIIVCNGKRVKIPTNLRDLLHRMRDLSNIKRLWADAICINQSDIKEVGHQVRQMSSIYSAAERVVVWTGLQDPFELFDENEEPAMLIRRYCDEVNRMTGLEALTFRTESKDINIRSEVIDANDELGFFFSAFALFLQQPWFDRLWVVQEVGLAKSAILLWGNLDQKIDFDILSDLTRDFDHKQPDICNYYGIVPPLLFLLFPRRSTIAGPIVTPNSDFLDMLETSRSKQASDPRDFVFALLGHPSAQTRNGLIIEPDYTKSHWEIYYELSTSLLQQSQDLRVLSAVRHLHEENLERQYPSWTPTWERTENSNSFGVLQIEYGLWEAHAGIPRVLQFNKAKDTLKVQGFAFDFIDEFTDEFRFSGGATSLGESHIDEWPITSALGFRAFSVMSLQEKMYELLTALVCGLDSDSAAEQGLKNFAAFRLQYSKRKSGHTKCIQPNALLPEGLAAAEEAADGGSAQTFLSFTEYQIGGRKLFTTRNGLVGAGPAILRADDICCILFGGNVPFLLRPVGSGYRLVGELYIRKVMQGEAVADFILNDKYPSQGFNIF